MQHERVRYKSNSLKCRIFRQKFIIPYAYTGVPHIVSRQDRSAVQTATIRSSSGSSADANLCSQLTPTATDSQTMNKLKRLPPTWAGQMSQTREIAESPDAAGRDAASTGRDGVKNTAQNIRIDTICALLTYICSPDVTKCDFSRRTNLFSQFSPDISH